MNLSSRVARCPPEEDELLHKLMLANASPSDIAVQLERSQSSVRARASAERTARFPFQPMRRLVELELKTKGK
jgi:hypothetical protein